MSDREYEVEKILDYRKRKGKPYYLIKWENYSDTDNTWEPKKNLTKNCLDLLDNFHRQKKNSLPDSDKKPNSKAKGDHSANSARNQTQQVANREHSNLENSQQSQKILIPDQQPPSWALNQPLTVSLAIEASPIASQTTHTFHSPTFPTSSLTHPHGLTPERTSHAADS